MNLFRNAIYSLLLLAPMARQVAADGHETDIILDLGTLRPEGIHMLPQEANVMNPNLNASATYALVGDLFWGSVRAVDVESGEIVTIVESPGYGVRASLGLWYSEGAIFLCGGGPIFPGVDAEASIYVYNISTGEEIVQCFPQGPTVFMNDVTIVDGKAYATDSLFNSIMVLDVAAALTGECVVDAIELPDSFASVNGSFGANGIIGYADGLLINQNGMASLHYLDLTTNMTSTVLPEGSLPTSDGLSIGPNEAGDGDILYNNENGLNRHSAWSLATTAEAPGVTADLLGYIVSDYYDAPATSDISGDTIYAVNARFGSLGLPHPNEADADFNETFSIVGGDRFAFVTLEGDGGEELDNMEDDTLPDDVVDGGEVEDLDGLGIAEESEDAADLGGGDVSVTKTGDSNVEEKPSTEMESGTNSKMTATALHLLSLAVTSLLFLF